jgi:hypothetical protein
MTKVNFSRDESSTLKSEIEELGQEKMTIERRIFESNETVDSYKNGKGPLQKLKQQTDNIQNEEIKKLMFQNEKLIQELNQLRRISITLSPEKIKRGDPKDIFQVYNHVLLLTISSTRRASTLTKKTVTKNLKFVCFYSSLRTKKLSTQISTRALRP